MIGRFDVLVVGAGVNGLATAWQLARRGAGRVGLIDRHSIGHDHGSSHGPTRITRSTYADPRLVARMVEANARDWPALEAAAGMPLRHPHPTFFFGPADGPITAYAEAVGRVAGSLIDDVAPAAARALAGGWLRIADGDRALHDRSGAVIAAADVIRSLERLVRAGGVEVIEGTPVRAIGAAGGALDVAGVHDRDGAEAGPVVVDTAAGTLLAERVVVTAGAWIGRLLPGLAGRLTPLRQTVAFLDVEGDPATAPNWVRVGYDDEPEVFGQPAFGHAGLKAAIHRQDGAPDDPDVVTPFDAASPAVTELLGVIDRCLAVPVRGVLGGMTCFYTMTSDHGFILGPLPSDPRVIVGAACSGHAFKFAPWTGRVLAGWAIGEGPAASVGAE
ncbi:MAG: FAD-dependent oxidoreductase [Ardenticatenales bacterium]